LNTTELVAVMLCGSLLMYTGHSDVKHDYDGGYDSACSSSSSS